MAELTYPVTCRLNHAPQSIANAADLATHHASEHEAVSMSDYQAQLSGGGSGAPDAPAPPPPPSFTNPLSAWGLNRSSFTSFTSSDVSSGSELSIQLALEFLLHFGRDQDPAFTVDVSSFLLDFFLYCLYNAATNDSTPTGGFQLREQAGPTKVYTKWVTVFSAARDFFDPLGYVFTPRRLMRTCDPLFWNLWQDVDVKALDRVRKEGTPISRQWRLPNGKHPPAYVLVPQLFNAHLTLDEHTCRKRHQYTVTKLSGSTADVAYDGLDPEDTVAASDLSRNSMDVRSEQLRAAHNATRTRGGVGSTFSPKADPILDNLYGHRRVGS